MTLRREFELQRALDRFEQNLEEVFNGGLRRLVGFQEFAIRELQASGLLSQEAPEGQSPAASACVSAGAAFFQGEGRARRGVQEK